MADPTREAAVRDIVQQALDQTGERGQVSVMSKARHIPEANCWAATIEADPAHFYYIVLVHSQRWWIALRLPANWDDQALAAHAQDLLEVMLTKARAYRGRHGQSQSPAQAP